MCLLPKLFGLKRRKRLSINARPKEPVPPVIRMDLPIKIGNGVSKYLVNECHAINSKVIIRRDFPTLPHSG